jgi:2-polyprenyl-3-methyl-5-hydroxy-6-metoxy-1,4-benzoquinol methylase
MTHNIEKVADINLENVATQIPRGRYYFRRHVARYQKMLESLPGKRPLAILDIGVGYGFLAAAMKKAGHRVVGLDFFYGEVAEDVCRQFAIPLFMLNVEAHELPFQDESFDVVVLGEVIEHFTSDPVGSLEKVRRVLKEDGMLIVTTPNSLSAVNRIKRFLGQGDRLTYHSPVMVSGNPYFYGHHRLFCMEELQELLEKAGYLSR